MVYPIEKCSKIFASFSGFPSPPTPKKKKKTENSIFFFFCVEKVFKKVI